MKKPWQGRFSGKTAESVETFTQSVSFDRRLHEADIRGSIAHARMLGKRGIITRADAERIIKGLTAIGRDIERGRFFWDPCLEDVHMNIEAELTRRIGPAGARLHAARSRNDQVATDLRLFVRTEADYLRALLAFLVEILLEKAEAYPDTVMPGYTHLQRAQPVLLGHHLLAWTEMLRRDIERFTVVEEAASLSPLGSGALAGTPLRIDRAATARELGFAGLTRNSLDAVGDRDFAAEFLFACSLCQVHLSRVAEEVVLWSTPEFGFATLPDSHCTGSSMMPQKKNPDVAELVRGKTGRTTGNLVSLLVTLKGLPLAYNRDLQEDKEPLFDSLDTVAGSLRVLAELLDGTVFHPERMRKAAEEGFLNATDLADYLVTRGVPFRDAHEASGKAVAFCLARSKTLSQLSLAELRRFHPAVERGVFRRLDLDAVVARRDLPGGTAPRQVREALLEARGWLREMIQEAMSGHLAEIRRERAAARAPRKGKAAAKGKKDHGKARR